MSWNSYGIGLLMLAALAGCEKPAAERPMVEIHGRTMGTFYGVKVVGDFPVANRRCKRRSIISAETL